MQQHELRTLPASFEMRETSDGFTLDGYAATFDQPYDIGPFTERIDAGAFNRTLGTSPDVRLLIDHEGQPLARTKSGTLALSADGQGLRAVAHLDPTDPDVARIAPKLRRRDLDQMSFSFRVPAGGDTWDHAGEKSLRTLRNVELQGGDVSIVTFPANENTTVSLRCGVSDQEAAALFIEAMSREVRAGKAISAENMRRLQTVLDSLATADDSLDSAEAAVAEILDVVNPDVVNPDVAEQNSYPLGLATAIARSLATS